MPPVVVEVISWPSSGGEFHTQRRRASDPRLLTYGDDEIPFEDGPFGDPMAEFVAPESGQFTIVVTNFASGPDDGGDGRFDYHLNVTEIESIGVEEPLPDFYAIA